MTDEKPDIDQMISSTKQRVQTLLARNWRTEVTEWGGWRLPWESTHVIVSVIPHPRGDNTLVQVQAPILWNVPYSEELAKFVALEGGNYFFGHIRMGEDDQPGTMSIHFTHTLLGDFLDEEELNWAVGAVGSTADELDDELKARFGGVRQADL